MKRSTVRICVWLVTLFLAVAMLAGCNSGGKTPAETPQKDVSEQKGVSGQLAIVTPETSPNASVRIRLAHTAAPSMIYDVPQHANSVVFQDVVQKRTQGKVGVVIHPASELGSEIDQIEMARSGQIEMVIATTGGLATYVPEVQVLSVPFAFSSEPIAWKVLDGNFGTELSEIIQAKTGLRVLGIAENGFRVFANSKHPIKTPDDMKGMKFRMMTIPAHLKLVEALGGAATPIPWSETFTAVQQGTVDGMDSPLWVLWSQKMLGSNIQKYVTLSNHVYDVHLILINEKFYQGLTEDVKKIVREAANAAVVTQRGLAQINNALVIEQAKRAGVEFYVPTEEEWRKFRDLAQAPVISFLKDNGLGPITEKLMSAIDAAER